MQTILRRELRWLWWRRDFLRSLYWLQEQHSSHMSVSCQAFC